MQPLAWEPPCAMGMALKGGDTGEGRMYSMLMFADARSTGMIDQMNLLESVCTIFLSVLF